MESTSPEETKTLVFTCSGCGKNLSVHPHQAGISGSCPSCGAWITSPHQAVDNPLDKRPAIPPRRSSRSISPRPKGRIPADSIIDHTHLEHSESAKTLKVIALTMLVVCVCLAAAWFLKDWAAK